MEPQVVKLTRQELYDLVWTKPLIHLSPDLYLSDVGLAKLCKRYHIPTPPVGYWMKVANGHAPSRPPLPTSDLGIEDSIEFKPATVEPKIAPQLTHPEVYQEFGTIRTDGVSVHRADSPKSLHPLLKDSFKGKASVNPNIHVSKELRERAYFLADMLFRFFESQGFVVELDREDYKTKTRLIIKGLRLQIGIAEKNKRIASDPIERQKSPWMGKHAFVPAGILTFKLGNRYGFEKEWFDSNDHLLEDRIIEVAEGVLRYAIRERIREIEWEVKSRQADEERKIEAEIEERKRQEKRRSDALEEQARQWRKSKTIRDFIEATIAHHKSQNGDLGPESEMGKWIAWATSYADSIDPVKRLPPSLSDELEDEFED